MIHSADKPAVIAHSETGSPQVGRVGHCFKEGSSTDWQAWLQTQLSVNIGYQIFLQLIRGYGWGFLLVFRRHDWLGLSCELLVVSECARTTSGGGRGFRHWLGARGRGGGFRHRLGTRGRG